MMLDVIECVGASRKGCVNRVMEMEHADEYAAWNLSKIMKDVWPVSREPILA